MPKALAADRLPAGPAGTDAHGAVGCQARDMLDRIAEKWALSVVHELAWGPLRFNELKRRIDGVSQRMLTATLRGLERDGLVTRTVYPVVPPRVDYRLTPLGVSLLDTVCRLMAWTIEHMSDIKKARNEFDRAAAADPAG